MLSRFCLPQGQFFNEMAICPVMLAPAARPRFWFFLHIIKNSEDNASSI
jgi:hypothetical protein